MKKLLSTLALVSALGFGLFGLTNVSYADDTKAVATATEAAPAADAAAAPAAPAAADAASAAPVPNKGDTAWMIVATVLVLMMCVPGLGLFYGGMARQKNMLSVLMQTFMITCVLGVLWALYSLFSRNFLILFFLASFSFALKSSSSRAFAFIIKSTSILKFPKVFKL